MTHGAIGWRREHQNIPQASAELKLTLAVKQRNLDRLEVTLLV